MNCHRLYEGDEPIAEDESLEDAIARARSVEVELVAAGRLRSAAWWARYAQRLEAERERGAR